MKASLWMPLFFLGALTPLRAATYPKLVGDPVNDLAGVISPEDSARISERAKEARSKKGIAIVVATIPSLADYGAAGWSIERFGAALYNEWGIGSPEKNKGILLLVAVKDRKLRIATGAGFGFAWDEPARNIIDGEIVPRFRGGDISGGIRAGVEAIAREVLTGALEGQIAEKVESGAPVPPAASPPIPLPASGGEGGRWQPRGTGIGVPRSGGWGLGGMIFLLFVFMILAAFISVVRGVFRVVTGGMTGSGRTWLPPSRASGTGWGGWGGFVTGGLLGFFGSRLVDSFTQPRRRDGGYSGGGFSSWGGDSSSGGGFSGGSSGAGSSFGGGYSSGGGASGSW
jgi:uncharacterized protein